MISGGGSTIEQIAVIGQIIEKKYEFRQNLWQIFIDFKKAYNNIHRENLYNVVMTEFGIPKKLWNLTKMYMEGTQYQIKTSSETSTVETELKQGDALSPILFNVILDKAVRDMQKDVTANGYRNKPAKSSNSRFC